MNKFLASYSTIIQETYLDIFGHMNNGTYLTLFEQARWDHITKQGYGIDKILSTGFGPILIEIKLNFLKELRVRDEITIETYLHSYEKRIAKLHQKMVRKGEVCSTAEVSVVFFSLKERKLAAPSTDWLKAIGVEE